MKSRRLSSVIFILIVASVFLCSCGIPTYLVPNTSILKLSGSGSDIRFNLKYQSENSGYSNADNIGLVLFYYVESDSLFETQTNYVKSWYSKNIRITERDGVVISPVFGEPICANIKGTNELEFDLYVFDDQHLSAQAPYYNNQIRDITGPVNQEYQISYIGDNRLSVAVYENSIQVQSFVLYMDNDIQLHTNDSICIYGAISVQSDNYSNLYWSDLYSLGSIAIE